MSDSSPKISSRSWHAYSSFYTFWKQIKHWTRLLCFGGNVRSWYSFSWRCHSYYCKRDKCSKFVTRVVSRVASMSIHCQNDTHVLQGKPIRRRPAVVFRATEMRFPARATSRLALAPDSSSPRTILSFLSFTVYNVCRVQLIHNASRLVASLLSYE